MAIFLYYHVPLKLTMHHTVTTKGEKKLMKILELKSTITKAKSSVDELNSIMESREGKKSVK